MEKTRSKYTNPDFQFARFRLGGADFGINLKSLREIIRFRELARPSGMPPFLEGLIRLRNMVVPVIDLRKRFLLASGVDDATRIMIVAIDGHIAGLIVDEVNDIMSGGKEIRQPQASAGPWDYCVETAIDSGSGAVHILNLACLITDSEKSFLDAPISGGSQPV